MEPKDSMRQPGDMSRVIIEGDGVDDVADHGEPIAVELAVALIEKLFSKLVPPRLLIGQGVAGDHDRAGRLPHGRGAHYRGAALLKTLSKVTSRDIPSIEGRCPP
ncbi:hypothetical protein GmRootV118_55850 [Variovorax sp. V118]